MVYRLILLTLLYNTAFATVLYEDKNILVTKEGVFSKRTGDPIEFTPSPSWVEEDFFTQQAKYCEKGGESYDGAKDEVGM